MSRKTALLGAIQAEHVHFESLLVSLDETTFTRPNLVGDWSIKVILAHLIWWEQQALGVLRGEPDIEQPDDEPWETTLQRINAQTFAVNRDRTLSEILQAWHVSYQQVLQAVEGLSEDQLADDDIYDDIVGNTFEHSQEHRQNIEAALS